MMVGMHTSFAGEGRRIQLWLNGARMVDYTETNEALDQSGIIGLQIHGGTAERSLV